MKKTISLPVYRRADRLARLLETLRLCGPHEYDLYVSAEPGHQDVIDVVKSVNFMPVSLSVNREKLGLNANVKKSLEMAMGDGSDFNIALEDDVALAPDAIRLADWFSEYDLKDEFACLGFFAMASRSDVPLEVCVSQDFRSWGWCFGKYQWDHYIVPGLHCTPVIPDGVKFSELWDFRMQYYLVSYGIETLHPLMSRSNHEGASDGTNDLDVELKKHFKDPALSDGSYGSDFYVTRANGRVTFDKASGNFIPVREKVSA